MWIVGHRHRRRRAAAVAAASFRRRRYCYSRLIMSAFVWTIKSEWSPWGNENGDSPRMDEPFHNSHLLCVL